MVRIFDPATDVAVLDSYLSTWHGGSNLELWFGPGGGYVPSSYRTYPKSWRTYPKSRLSALIPADATPEGFCYVACGDYLDNGDFMYVAYCSGDALHVLVPDTMSDEEGFDMLISGPAKDTSWWYDSGDPEEYSITDCFAI